jgi:hypothetical protein
MWRQATDSAFDLEPDAADLSAPLVTMKRDSRAESPTIRASLSLGDGVAVERYAHLYRFGKKAKPWVTLKSVRAETSQRVPSESANYWMTQGLAALFKKAQDHN